MITFLISILLLFIGYYGYGKIVERIFGINQNRPPPALSQADGVDFVAMNKNRNFLIQLLNISGIGPIFGPILGALYGPVAFIWIVFGAIFAGAVHDYLTGMISVRNQGAHLPELAGIYLGSLMKHGVNAFSIILLLLVGTVFVSAPANLIQSFTPDWLSLSIIMAGIFCYYIVATLLPIDKIIGRLYPLFGLLLIISAAGVGLSLIFQSAAIPEMDLSNWHPEGTAIFPLLFLTISCGALSGFHATQSPIIACCMQNEKHGRQIFYGSMIAEAIIAMIWAAAAMSLFDNNHLLEVLNNGGGPAAVVFEISTSLLGAVGGTFAVLGVIILPITSGDTAFRSARIIIAKYFKIPQQKFRNRILIALPVFALSFLLTTLDFNILWRYFSWANQSTAMIALWICTMYLYLKNKNYWIAAIPACFITITTFTYILNAKIAFNLPIVSALFVALSGTLVVIILFHNRATVCQEDSFLIKIKQQNNLQGDINHE